MVIPLVSAAGFCALAIAELAILGGRRASALVSSAAGYLGVGTAVLLHASGAPAPAVPDAAIPELWRTAAGGALAAASSGLLLWAVFLEIPRERKRLGIGDRGTVRTGSYGRCRHPGWWWLAIHVLSWCVMRPGASLASDAMAIIGGNLALVYAQDRWFFPARFDDYREYRSQVPFLVPRASRRSPPDGASR